MRAGRLFVCFLILATAIACTKQPEPPKQAGGFVRRQGTRLVLDGRPFRFHGLNYYDINALAGDNPYHPGTRMVRGCRFHTQMPQVEESLARIGSAANVLRAWFYQPFAVAVPLVGGESTRDWSVFDRTLAAVKRAGMKIIVTFAELNGGCDLPNVRRNKVAWFRSGYRNDIPAGMIAPYRSYVSEIVTRYREHPEILAWQLVNEPSALKGDGRCDESQAARTIRSFADDVGGLIKSIDPNHLVSMGTGPAGGCGFGGKNLIDYRLVHASPAIDLCEHHDYLEPTVALPSTILRELVICGRLRKPLFVGEVGIRAIDVPGRCPKSANFPACRAELLKAKFHAQLGASSLGGAGDVIGVLVWDWCEPAWTRCEPNRHDIVPGDPTLTALSALPTS